MINIEDLDDWQKEALAHEGDLLLCTGRQIGKTTIMAIKAAKKMMTCPGTQIIIVSLTEDQAKLIINMILSYLEKYAKPNIAKGKDKPTQNRITLKNKSWALARPVGTTGDAIRGFTGDVLIIDEGSRFPELAFTSGEPTLLSTGGEVWMCSTPYGKTGYFWEQYNSAVAPDESESENEMGWKVIHVNAEEQLRKRRISQSWPEEQRSKALGRLESLKKRWSRLRYGQEILAQFMDDLNQYFPDEIIKKVMVLRREPSPPKDNNYMGVDIARMGRDETVYTVLHIYEDRVHQMECIVKKRQYTTDTEREIIALNRSWNTRKIGIDMGSGALGVGVGDALLEHPDTKRRVVAMNNRKICLDKDGKTRQRIFKEDMYDNLLAMMEKGEILLLDDESIFASLKSIQYEYDENAKISKRRIFGNYSHITEALIRAAWLAKKEKLYKPFITYI